MDGAAEPPAIDVAAPETVPATLPPLYGRTPQRLTGRVRLNLAPQKVTILPLFWSFLPDGLAAEAHQKAGAGEGHSVAAIRVLTVLFPLAIPDPEPLLRV
jgi:hypothetical protein